jgi:flagellar hook-associated protein 1
MASLHDSLTIARSAILAHQERLAVISDNIANVNTPGYHRKRVMLATNPAIDPTMLEVRKYDLGTGVTVAGVMRAYNGMTEALLREQAGFAGYHEAQAGGLGSLEALLNGSADGSSLATGLQQFWNAWQDVAVHPDTLAFRSVLIEQGAALADQFSTLDDRLVNFRSQIVSGVAAPYVGLIPAEVGNINGMLHQLQDLNYRISYSLSHFQPNTLLDTRTELLRELSDKLDIVVDADFNVTLDGQTLVNANGSVMNELVVTDIAAGAEPAVRYEVDGVEVTVAGGTLGGWTNVVDTADSMRAMLDTLAGELMNAVNAIHNSDHPDATSDAFDWNGDRSTLDFFTGTGAADMRVNALIRDPANPMNNNPHAIAAAGEPSPGNGAKALEIAALTDARLPGLNELTLLEYFTSHMGSLGARVETATQLARDGEAIVGMLLDAIQDETGVNLDEELVELVSAQRAYQAAVRLFTTIDGMLDTVINRMGA